jgi:hypothetical protein
MIGLFTHRYDLFSKILAFCVALFVILPQVDKVSHRELQFIIYVGLVLAGLSWWFLFRPLSSWLYARFSLSADLKWREASRVSVLFSPILPHKLDAMKHVKALPVEERATAIISAANIIHCGWSQASRFERSLRAFLWISLGLTIILCRHQIPPFTWLSAIQTRLFRCSFDDKTNLILTIVPIAIAIAILEMRARSRSAMAVQDDKTNRESA